MPDYAGLRAALADPEELVSEWIDGFEASSFRLPGSVERQSLASSLAPIVEAFAGVVAPDRAGREPEDLHFQPGAAEVREIEKAVSFAAANLGAGGFSGFDVGALLLALRDVLCAPLSGAAEGEMHRYMEWLVLLAGDSLAKGREQAAMERWRHELDEGTPLIMITPTLPAALFVCRPDRGVVSGVFGRMLLMIVRTEARAVIVDVRGMSASLEASFAEPLEKFLSHVRVAGKVTVFCCGVRSSDVDSWGRIGERAGAALVFESHFDLCVSGALKIAGSRLVTSP